MAIVASIVDIRGKAYEPVITEILFENATVADNLVAFETDVKAESIFTENVNTAVMQVYTCGAPASAGTLGVTDTIVTPKKVLYYQEFCMETLRTSRFKRSMKPGAWEMSSSEFERTVLASYGQLMAQDAERAFWNGASTATKAAIAALTPGAANTSASAAEQAWSAAQTANVAGIDGIVAKMIYNNGALGSRVKVLGTAITSANIAAEYAKLYTAVPAVVLTSNSKEAPYFYVPYSHKQMINIYNITNLYRDLFSVSDDRKTYFYSGVEIKFVPLAENVMIAALPSNLIWATDLLSDIGFVEVNKVANNQDNMFIKTVFTLAAHVVNQKYNVLYLG